MLFRSLAKNAKGSVLFPARMHMLFKGISGVYACANANCSCSHSEGGLTLGEVYLSDGNLTCPHCGSVVYEPVSYTHLGRHMFRNSAVLPLSAIQTAVGSNAVVIVKDFDNSVSYPHIHLAFDIFVRNGV